jgi:molybdate transport system ATP-binding protein
VTTLRVQCAQERGDFRLAADFQVPASGITALFGPSGSGKTSVLRCIAGIGQPAQGVIEVAGECWQDSERQVFLAPHRRRLGYVFQDAGLLAHLSVRGNLEYGLRRTPPAERWLDYDRAVALTGVGHLLERRPPGLSGGERSRVAIARALLTGPKLLLMDEPLAALDMRGRAEILPFLEQLHAELSIPVLYVSHALDEVARLADHMVCMEQGRTIAAGPIREILTRLDLPLAHQDEASAVIDARMAGRDEQYRLAMLEFHGQRLSVTDQSLAMGSQVRVRILARDVSLSLEHHANTSILNIFPVTVSAIDEDRPAQVLVRLDANGATLLARITHKSRANLGLVVGSRVYAQIKSVALLK